ncbi:SDR family oxidoreductase [Salicibibacter cibi]|uniref:SDR family oxidoreductase n=1 Tax=Salicibibacter cibi TaxID=2743001 RepID=A0A7T6ZEE3_9BACI|nr:SDR family oxidoreductase [Salicibibacter cibi]
MTEVSQFGMERTKIPQSVMPRAGTSEEIANVALFLASDDSSFLNGVVIPVDRG